MAKEFGHSMAKAWFLLGMLLLNIDSSALRELISLQFTIKPLGVVANVRFRVFLRSDSQECQLSWSVFGYEAQ